MSSRRGRWRAADRAATVGGAVLLFGLVAAALALGRGRPDSLVHIGVATVAVSLGGRTMIAAFERRSQAVAVERQVATRTAELQATELRFRTLVECSLDVMTVLDGHGGIVFQTPSAGDVFGYPPLGDDVATIWDLLHPGDLAAVRGAIDSAVALDGQAVVVEWRQRLGSRHAATDTATATATATDDGFAWCESTVRSMLTRPGLGVIVVETRDMTERNAMQQQLVQEALHDPLTHLANRALLNDRIAVALGRSGRSGAQVGLIVVDLDDFKAINDGLGHAAGDQVIVTVARRLAQCVRPGDTVARLGGDEFAVLLDGADSRTTPETVAERIHELLRLPSLVANQEVIVSASVGVATAPPGSLDGEQLLHDADVAMYTAKAAGKSQVATFAPDMHLEMLDRSRLTTALRNAVRNEEFTLRFQPLVDLESRRIVGAEALVRWDHPQRGLLRPGDFIAMAETSGVIVPLGRWIIRQALDAIAVLQAARHEYEPPLSITVNLSARQFRHPDFASELSELLVQSGVDPGTVILEVTEGTLMDDMDKAMEVMADLKSLGIRLALDDFGSGYSSLAWLRRLPVDILKIDRTFIENLDTPDGSALVHSILGLGDSFGVATSAEGIETEEQLAELRRLGCTYGQGYLFARPVRQADLAELLARQTARVTSGLVLSAAGATVLTSDATTAGTTARTGGAGVLTAGGPADDLTPAPEAAEPGDPDPDADADAAGGESTVAAVHADSSAAG